MIIKEEIYIVHTKEEMKTLDKSIIKKVFVINENELYIFIDDKEIEKHLTSSGLVKLRYENISDNSTMEF